MNKLRNFSPIHTRKLDGAPIPSRTINIKPGKNSGHQTADGIYLFVQSVKV